MRLAPDRYMYMNMDWADLDELNRLGDEGWHPATALLGIREHGVDRWRGLMVRRRTEGEAKVRQATAEGWEDHQARRGDLCPPKALQDDLIDTSIRAMAHQVKQRDW